MRKLLFSILLIICSLSLAEPIYDCYISVGDNHFLADWLPIDSPEALDASIELLKDAYDVRRIYWRGLQDSIIINSSVSRPEYVLSYAFRKWNRYLINDLEINRKAVIKAKELGIEIWGCTNLIDWGCHADAGGHTFEPYHWESFIRKEYPEFIPTDKYKYRIQGGPIEFGYPQARKLMIDDIVKYVKSDGYQGVLFLNYVENYATRFEDEFGYSEIVAEEFKKRYGKDIYNDKFDRWSWYQLRGEYVTQFFREMKEKMPEDAKKIGLVINPREPHFPQPWPHDKYFLSGGRTYVDWPAYIRESLVDYLTVYGSCATSIQSGTTRLLEMATRGHSVEAALLTTHPWSAVWDEFKNNGTVITVYPNTISSIVKHLPAQSLSKLETGSYINKLKVLAMIENGTLQIDTDRILKTFEDDNILVRRQVLVALKGRKDKQTVEVMKRALYDEQSSVRGLAVKVYAQNFGSKATNDIMKALDENGVFPMFMQGVYELKDIKDPDIESLLYYAENGKNNLTRALAYRLMCYVRDERIVPVLIAGVDDKDRLSHISW